jgi:tetratricopeptide (TPR) repeat protein
MGALNYPKMVAFGAIQRSSRTPMHGVTRGEKMKKAIALAAGAAAVVLCSLHSGSCAGDELRQYRSNPPSEQFDMRARDKHSVETVRKVELYHWELAMECQRKKRLACAFNNLDFMLRWVPNHSRALNALVDLGVEHKRPDLALPYLEAAVAFCPKCADLYVVAGNYDLRIGKVDSAIGQYRKSLELNPNSADAHYNLGLSYFKQGNRIAANESAQKAYALGYPLPGLREKLKGAGAWKP